MTTYDPNIDEWIYLIKGNHIPHCREQELALDNNIIPVLERKDVYVDSDRIKKGLTLQKYLPFDLLPWERYQFAIIAGVFLRIPGSEDDIYFHEIRDIMGRGSGKNGFIDFLAMYFISPLHGVRGYNVDLIANGEEQAGTSIKDVGEIISEPVNPAYARALAANYKVYAEKIIGKKTRSEFRLNTTSTKNKDSKRTGAVIFDEKHQYVDTRNMNTLKSGLGKVKWAREITITTDGHERGGVLDQEKMQNEVILHEYNPLNRKFINWFRIEDPEKWDQMDEIVKANPSIWYPSFATLKLEIQNEITDMPYKPDYYPEFMAKRCNYPISDPAKAVADWNDIVAGTRPPDFEPEQGEMCVGGLDYTKTNDFCGCIVNFRRGDKIVTKHHSFICRKSVDLPNIHAPIAEWVKAGYCTIIDDVEISPDVPVQWFYEMSLQYTIVMIGIDGYRYSWLNKAFKAIGYDAFDKDNKRIYIVRPSDIAQVAPMINSAFLHNNLSGWDRMMCWYTNNAVKIQDTKGNVSYGKQDPHLRKTDGFMGWVHAMCVMDYLPDNADMPDLDLTVQIY